MGKICITYCDMCGREFDEARLYLNLQIPVFRDLYKTDLGYSLNDLLEY
jgi:hypothetical protein